MSKGLIGTPVRRLEDAALLTGEARFVDDIELPGMLECAFVRSPHPHAVIRSINSDAAIEFPGILRQWQLGLGT